ncbi:MAG TPA: anhydro-N-acetylmuramic acid kinase [Candidatus Gastranaerophilales bacterium]|nr:anhydro-N-acetylmuramic acid kinase [Candidatus Gastranaerophilales bacterium]
MLVDKPETKIVVGLMSGTSVDGVDACLVKIHPDLSIEFIDGILYSFPDEIKKNIFKLFQNQTSTEQICWMNFVLGECFAQAALDVIKKAGLTPEKVDLIGSHGQTIFHKPQDEFIDGINKKSTLQIGEASVISERTGITTVYDFRTADIAAGGQGAPLVSFFDEVFFKKNNKTRAVQNIGGIANVTVVGSNFPSFAFDTGPGNVFIDYCSNKFFNQPYDKDGMLADQGIISNEWLDALLNLDYYKKNPPKTTGRELFNLDYIETSLINAPENPYDIIATITHLTAMTIFKAYKDFIFPVASLDQIILGGGGAFNPVLVDMIKNLFGRKLEILQHEDFGIPDEFKEAIAFALLAYTAYYRIPNNIPSCTGARHQKVLGKFSFK